MNWSEKVKWNIIFKLDKATRWGHSPHRREISYYESLKIRLVKVGAFIDHLNTFGSTEDKQIFYKFLKEVNTESIRCNAKLDITIENASKPELWYRYPSNPNTFKECFKLFNLCFYRNVVKDSVDKIINWFKK